MERFRFRIWDPYLEKFYYFSIGDYIDKHKHEWMFREDTIINQCTGLKDKNGTYIYEGDIVEIEIHKKPEIGVVKWDNTSFIVDIICNKRYELLRYIMCFGSYFIKVVGNIYENSDLLKKILEK